MLISFYFFNKAFFYKKFDATAGLRTTASSNYLKVWQRNIDGPKITNASFTPIKLLFLLLPDFYVLKEALKKA